MTGILHGDHVSCSRIGGAMRHESSRLRQHAQSLVEAFEALAASEPPDGPAGALVCTIPSSVSDLLGAADDLDQAGAALQRYATDLAESHELARRAERRVEEAGLLLDGTRAIEPWGPASSQEAQRRRAQIPEVQARVDLATAQVGRARGRLQREMQRLTEGFSARSTKARSAKAHSPQTRSSKPRSGRRSALPT